MSAVTTGEDIGSGYVAAVADDELLVGHVLTSVAGWGPELEINIAVSSIGQDEIGHARRLYELGLGGPVAAERRVYESPAADLGACRLVRSYPRRWESLVVRQFLYEEGDHVRLGLLRGCSQPGLAALAEEMEHEERYHRDFWRTWLDSTAGKGADAKHRLQAELDCYWPVAGSLLEIPTDVETVLGLEAGTFATALDDHLQSLVDRLAEHGLRVPDVVVANSRAEGAGPDDRLDEMLAEMRSVYADAPGSW